MTRLRRANSLANRCAAGALRRALAERPEARSDSKGGSDPAWTLRTQFPTLFVSSLPAESRRNGWNQRSLPLRIGVSLILIAAGAILTWGVNATVSGLNLHTVGIILMVVGALGLLLSVIFWSNWGGFGKRSTTVVQDGPRTQ